MRNPKKHNPDLSVAECYDWAWEQKTDAAGKVILLALADNGGWVKELRPLLAELGVWMPSTKIHMTRLLHEKLVHFRVGGGYVLDLAVADAVAA